MAQNTLDTAVAALNQRVSDLSTDASPEQLAYLGKAVESIGGRSTVLDVMQTGTEQNTLLLNTATAQKDALTALASEKTDAFTTLAGSKITAVTQEGTEQVQAVQQEGSTQITAVRQEGQQFKDDVAQILDELGAPTNNMVGLEVVDTKLLKLNTMSDSYAPRGSNTYRTMIKVNEKTFAMATLLYAGNGNNYTEATMTPFFVNDDGTLSASSPKQIFGNTSGNGISTTQFFSVEGTGKMFAYGNNCYPGQSSHKFGYFYGRVDANGNVANTGSATNADYHYTNGQFGGMYDSDGNGFYAVGASYSQSDSKSRHVRINYDGDTPSLGVTNPSSDTSTNYASHIIPQKGVSNTNIVGIVHYRTNSNTYYERAYNSGGSSTNYTIPNWDSNMIGFVLSSGAVLNISSGNAGYRACVYEAYNSRTVINDFELDSNYFYPYWSQADITSVGKDIWLVYNYQAKMIFTFHIDPNSYKVTILDSAFVGMSVGNNSNTSLKVAGANNEFLVACQHSSSAYDLVKVLKNPLKMSLGA